MHSWVKCLKSSAKRSFLVGLILVVCCSSASAFPSLAWIGNWKGKSGALTNANMYKLVSAFKDHRAIEEDMILLSCGSMFGPSTTSNHDKGKLILSLMNQCKVDAMAVGPHDFFAGSGNVLELAAKSDFPFICSNLKVDPDKIDAKTSWEQIKPSVTISRSGKKILVLAVVCPDVPTNWPNWDPALSFENPKAALDPFKEKADEADMVVLLSNMEFSDNLRLLKDISWIDVVLANPISNKIEEALDYDRFDFGLNDGRRICWAMPNRSPGYGVLKTIMENGKPWLLATPRTVSKDYEGDSSVLAEVQQVAKNVYHAAGAPISDLSETELKDVVYTYLRIMRAETNAEIAVIHESAIRSKKILENPTALDIKTSFPFPDRIALMNVSGKDLRHVWENRNKGGAEGRAFRILGMKKYKDILVINGRPLRDNDTYRLATTEYLANGGFGLLPADLKSVRSEKLTDLISRHLKDNSLTQREKKGRAPDYKSILRQKLTLSGTYNQSAFSDAAGKYQYKDPKAAYTGSDIPGLVGNQYISRKFTLDYEAVLDKRNSDTVLRVNSTFSKYNTAKLSDKWQMLLRHSKKSLKQGFLPFYELQLTGAHFDPEISGKDKPLFGRAVAGIAYKYSDRTQFLLGVGHLKRFSVNGEPGNTGLNFGFEYARELRPGLDLNTWFDGFMTQDSDKIRTFDSKIELKAKVYKRLSIIMRERLFGWKDSTIGSMGTRRETFTGLGYDLILRNFR